MSRIRFLEDAESEFLQEVEYYAKVQVNAAAQFRKAVEAAAARALNFPKAGLSYFGKTRRVFVRGYPFFLVYREEPGGIAVFAVVHEVARSGLLGVTCALTSRLCTPQYKKNSVVEAMRDRLQSYTTEIVDVAVAFTDLR